MKQTILSVVLEVQPESCTRLSGLIDALKKREESAPHGIPERYDRLKREVPALHLMSISVFPSDEYDPLFVIEANFDGEPGIFWAQLEAAIGPDLRQMIRCCKRPLDEAGPMFDAVTAPGSGAPIAPYLEARTKWPSARHQGNRGMGRDRILAEHELFLATRTEIACNNHGGASPYRGTSAVDIHNRLRAALLPAFPWLDTSAPARISLAEKIGDRMKVLGVVFAALFLFSIPGLVIAPIAPAGRHLLLFGVLSAIALFFLLRMKAPLPGTKAERSGGLTPASLSTKNKVTSLAHPIGLVVRLLLLLALYVGVASLIGALLLIPVTGLDFEGAWKLSFRSTLLGLGSIVFSVLAILTWVRWLERRDSSHDAPPIDQRLMREMVRREDWIAQSHMGSVVLVKPGMLRSPLIHVGHLALGLVLRATATDGYLGSMRTIHFAHWAWVNNGSRLMFFSNFDHSWESYLDDFIEKAHGGLTLAWSSSVGFPPTRFLVMDGASHGRKFKAWARHSMAVSRFWFSAYRDLTTDQIERNYRIALGLRKKTLSQKEADLWVNDL